MFIFRCLLLIFLVLGQTSWAIAASRVASVAILADDTPLGSQMRKLLQDEFRESGVIEAGVSAGRPAEGADFVLTVGLMPLRQLLQQDLGKPVVAVMVTRAALEAELARQPQKTGRNFSLHAVVLDQPPGRYLDLIRLAFPQRRRVGFLLGSADETVQKSLERSALARGVSLSVERIHGESSFVARLEQVLSQSEVLLALSDPLVHNRNTVQPLLLTTYRAGVPVVAYSEAYVQAGALVGLYSTPEQMAHQAAVLVRELAHGRPGGQRIQMPQDFTVSVNATVARSLGMVLPSPSVLLERLKRERSDE